MTDGTLIVEVGGETIVTVERTISETMEIAQQLGYSGFSGYSGAVGQGVPAGGTTGQVLRKKSNTSYDTEWG